MALKGVCHSLINMSQLDTLISKFSPIIFDATRNGFQVYSQNHIPGAKYFDQTHCVRPLRTCIQGFPDKDCFQEYVQKLGLETDDDIVVYDQGLIPISAARAKWTLDAFGFKYVSVLNGGLKAWTAAHGQSYLGGYDDSVSYEKTNCELSINHNLVVNFEEMKEIVRSRSHTILDTRNEEHFKGILPEPSLFTLHVAMQAKLSITGDMFAGHMPGAINFRYSQLIDDETGLFNEDPIKIMEILNANSIDLSKPIVTLCYNGNAAALLRLAFNLIGKHDVSVYYGSWTQYGQMCQEEDYGRYVKGLFHLKRKQAGSFQDLMTHMSQ